MRNKFQRGFTLSELPVVRKRAFTLIELLVVIAIIAILATIVILNISSAVAKARYSKTLEAMSTLGRAAMTYEAATGKKLGDGGGGGETPGREGTENADFKDYLPKWPDPVCKDWTYDWENWTLTDNPGIAALGDKTQVYQGYERETKRVTLREPAPQGSTTVSPSRYFYCLQFKPKNASDPYCLEGTAGKNIMAEAGGEDIIKKADKKLTCN